MTRLRTHNKRAKAKRLSWRQKNQRSFLHKKRRANKWYDATREFHRVLIEAGSTITGRLHRIEPDMQNLYSSLPKEFVGIPAIDFSKLEARVMARLTGKRDVHAELAKKLGVTRDRAKKINYMMMYGVSKNTLAKKLGE